MLEGNKYFTIANGFISIVNTYDSKFTFYRGKFNSQIDLAISSSITDVILFCSLDKKIYSDHCPISISCNIKYDVDLNTINECAKGHFNYDSLDINKRSKILIVWQKVAAEQMKCRAARLLTQLHDLDDDPGKLDVVCTAISDTIYSSCKNNYKTNVVHTVTVVNQVHCNSTNYKPITEINLYTYNIHTNNNLPPEFCNKYLQDWVKYENLAR